MERSAISGPSHSFRPYSSIGGIQIKWTLLESNAFAQTVSREVLDFCIWLIMSGISQDRNWTKLPGLLQNAICCIIS